MTRFPILASAALRRRPARALIVLGLALLTLGPAIRPREARAQIITNKKELAILQTAYGKIVIEFFSETAPRHVATFKKNIREGVYEGTTIHRIIPDLAIVGGDPFTRDGDPSNDGWGGFGPAIPNEFSDAHLNVRSAIGALRKPDEANPDQAWNGFQFYILLSDQPALDASHHTVFARVREGMDVVDRLAATARDDKGAPKDRLEFKKIYLESR